ncbi:MAG: hypothetical protein ACQESC_04210 [Nanobdellota archaeon]
MDNNNPSLDSSVKREKRPATREFSSMPVLNLLATGFSLLAILVQSEYSAIIALVFLIFGFFTTLKDGSEQLSHNTNSLSSILLVGLAMIQSLLLVVLWNTLIVSFVSSIVFGGIVLLGAFTAWFVLSALISYFKNQKFVAFQTTLLIAIISWVVLGLLFLYAHVILFILTVIAIGVFAKASIDYSIIVKKEH